MATKRVLNPPYVSPKQKQVNAFREALEIKTPEGEPVGIRSKDFWAWGDANVGIKADVPHRLDPVFAQVHFDDPLFEDRFTSSCGVLSSKAANLAGIHLDDVKAQITLAARTAGLPEPIYTYKD